MNSPTIITPPRLADITCLTIEEAVKKIAGASITTRAPRGYSSDEVYLFGDEHHRSSVSIRNHSGMASLLITDPDGYFLFYGQLTLSRLNPERIAQLFYFSFDGVRYLILPA